MLRAMRFAPKRGDEAMNRIRRAFRYIVDRPLV